MAEVEVMGFPLYASAPQASLRYMPGLDVVRGMAILAVLLYHGLAGTLAPTGATVDVGQAVARSVLEFGSRGVHLFFVLSGFLITGILLKDRLDRDYYRNFYLRRILRIVPAYLLMIAVLKLTHSIGWRFVAASLFYLANMTALLHTTPEYGPFWSLSVEEQFYLVWPLVVRHVGRRTLLILSFATIAITPMLRLALQFGPDWLSDIYFKTWDVADLFAAGALLAIGVRMLGPNQLRRFLLPLFVAGAIGLAVLLIAPVPSSPATRDLLLAFQLEPWLLLFSGLVLFAFLNPGISRLSAFRPLVFLANISYGLYLCHTLVFDSINHHWNIGPPESPRYVWLVLLRFGVEAAIAIAIAYLSRRTYEEFFLRLKPKHQPTLGSLQRGPS